MTQKPKHFRRVFSSWWFPRVYDLWVFIATLGNTKGLRENVLEFIPKNPQIIYDLATGTGENALLLKKKFPLSRVLASDLAEGTLKVAQRKAVKQRLDIEFSLQDATATDYPSGLADVVVISFALHDLSSEKRKELTKEAYRLLKPRGVFIIYDYHLPTNWLVRIPLIVQFLLVENLDAWHMLKENLEEKLQKVDFYTTNKKTFFKGLAQIVTGTK